MTPWLRSLRPRQWWHWILISIVAVLVIGGIGNAASHKTTTASTGSNPTIRKLTSQSTLKPDAAPGAHTTTTNTTAEQTTTAPHVLSSPAATTARPGGGCRSGDPLANVYHSHRLKVENPCLTVTGTVAYVRGENDGDVHFDLSLPASETSLLDQANYAHEDGQLVAEIVPADQPGCTPGQPPPLPPTAYRSSSYNYGICTGAGIATPPLGAQVQITGPYVLDSDHGWMEIHPVWAITVMAAPSSSPETTASPPPTLGTAPTQPQRGSSAAWCQASAAVSNDNYPGDYEVYVHSNQPDAKATASDAGDTWSEYTDSVGYADIRLYHTSPGMTITVNVGAASCSTTA